VAEPEALADTPEPPIADLEVEAIEVEAIEIEEVAVIEVAPPEPEPEPEPMSQPPDEPEPEFADEASLEALATGDGTDDLWEEADETPSPGSRVHPPTSPAPPGHLPERRVVVIDEGAADYVVPETRSPSAGPQAVPGAPGEADIGARLQDEDEAPKRRWRLFRKGGE
jgi:hypothetical protein